MLPKKDKRDRGVIWSSKEISCLLDVWEDKTIKEELESVQKIGRRNLHVYEKMVEQLQEKGYSRTPAQVRTKVKKLINQYKELIDRKNRSDMDKRTLKYFERLDGILGHRLFAGSNRLSYITRQVNIHF